METVYKLLHSGFVGKDSSSLVKIPQEQNSVLSALISQSIFRADTSNYYDSEVSELYNQMAVSPKVFSDFNFRETLIRKTFEVFGKVSFVEWFKVQQQSPSYTYLHERFLKETLLFIYEGKSRTMAPGTYYRLLHVGKNEKIFSVEDRLKEFKELNDIIEYLYDNSTLTMINRWTDTTEGLQDLLMTLNVIFGQRGLQS